MKDSHLMASSRADLTLSCFIFLR